MVKLYIYYKKLHVIIFIIVFQHVNYWYFVTLNKLTVFREFGSLFCSKLFVMYVWETVNPIKNILIKKYYN